MELLTAHDLGITILVVGIGGFFALLVLWLVAVVVMDAISDVVSSAKEPWIGSLGLIAAVGSGLALSSHLPNLFATIGVGFAIGVLAVFILSRW